MTRKASGGGVDTATRVLSVRDLAEAGEDETDGDGGKDAGDRADGDPSENVTADGDGADASGEAPDEDGESDRETPDADDDASAADGDTSDGTSDRDSAGADGDAPDAASSDADGDVPGAEGDARLRNAVAAWVRSADGDGGKDAPAASGTPERAVEASDDAGDEDDRDGDRDGGSSAAEGKAGASGTAAEADASAGEADETDATDDADASDASDASAGEADETDATDDADASDASDASADKADDATADDAPSGTRKAADQPTTMLKIGDLAKARAGKGPVDQPTTMLKLGDAAPKPVTDAKPGGKPDGTADAEPDAKAAPTADAESAPKTDAEPKPGKDGENDKPGKDGGESEAERTSKFVALKPLDDPSTRRPPRPSPAGGPPVSEATTALRKVTPGAKPTAPGTAKPTTPGDAKPAPAGPAAAKPAPAEATAAIPQVGPERTTQQPLPPKPPLDLLAELTNTPPPPQTPLRTAVRRVKIWTPLVLLLVIVFAIVQAVRPLPTPTLVLTAADSHTFAGDKVRLPWPGEGQGWMDVDGVGTMDSFGNQTPVPIGSVAKTMTAYIILRDHPLKVGEGGPKIQIDALAEKEGGYSDDGESTLNTVKAGQFLTEQQALSAIMIPSANNIARLLARWDAGSEAAFVKKMNATAKELGMTNTTYTDPSGLKETTVSTAHDQVTLGRAVVKNPALVDITSKASWTDPSGTYHNNYNELPYKMGAIGIKTGSTTAAGGNLLFASRKTVGGKTVTLVGAVLGQQKPTILKTVNAVSKTALLAAQDALTSAKILKKGDVVGYVDDQLGGHTPVVLTQDVTAVGWAGLKVTLSFAADELPHTAKAGAKVGTLTVGDGTSGAVKVPVALERDLTEPGFADKLTRLG
ncbi:D-alanyl-D-alanine carboxypeptidase [Streptomyces sp. NPDC014801]|uniref:D-alanyl-D-alanine carboxypeptidase n=1 Tax=Streptomyces sp. NPDC014801 TaxID=3364916 RepID=UPI0036FCD985